MSSWMQDTRAILQVKLPNHKAMFTHDTYKLRRTERNGEYCMIGWIAIQHIADGITIEAPLNAVEFITFDDTGMLNGD